MTNVTSLSKRPYLTKEDVFKNMSEEIGDSDKVLMVGLKDDGTVVAYSTNNLTPAEELFMSTFLQDRIVQMAFDACNINTFSEDTWI